MTVHRSDAPLPGGGDTLDAPDRPTDRRTPDGAPGPSSTGPEPDPAVPTPHDGSADAPAPAPARPYRPRRSRYDLLAALIYLAGAVLVTGRGWVDVDGRLLGSRPNDQGFNEWMLAYGARAVTHLENPFFTTMQNAPDGVNLMTNVGMQLPGLVLSPLTLLFGAPFAYLFFITVNLAGTGYAWYHVLSRHVVRSRAAAFTGGLFCALAPALVSHSNGHPHITAQWLVPFIVWRVVRLTRGERVLRDGLGLGVLLGVQFFIGLEILFLIALGCAMGVLGWLAVRPRQALAAARPLLSGLAVAGGLVLLVGAYPLWMQFAGPQHRVGHPGDPDAYALKLGSYVAYATESVGGGPVSAKGLVANTTEQASFYGWPLLVLVLGVVLWLRREVLVRVLAVIAVVSALFSIGTTWTWGTRRTAVPAPFALVKDLPVFDSLVVSRFALITTVVVGVLLALAVDRVRAPELRRSPQGAVLAGLGAVALLAVLVPVAPTSLPAQGRKSVPDFVTSGAWRDHVADGRTLVPVPVDNMTSLYWSSAALAGFAVPQGYFLGPVSSTDATGRWGVEPRPTAVLLTAVGEGKRGTPVTPADRDQALADARYWKADAVVLPAHARQADLRAVLDALYGPGRRVDDVWLWDVRPYTR
ncbi:hypothetical protein ACH4OY_27245 [Micromonospora rubida]|uniref:DUF6311 domain-containing protein n=1 Tax=Micromonospora rubida TaxID=2697657 RepID=A0ABW7SV39_9ACTN